MPSRAMSPARGEPMLPRPAIRTVSANELGMIFLLFRPPGLLTGERRRVLAEPAGRRVGPARPGPPPLGRLDLVEPAAAARAANDLVAVRDRPAANRTGRPA